MARQSQKKKVTKHKPVSTELPPKNIVIPKLSHFFTQAKVKCNQPIIIDYSEVVHILPTENLVNLAIFSKNEKHIFKFFYMGNDCTDDIQSLCVDFLDKLFTDDGKKKIVETLTKNHSIEV